MPIDKLIRVNLKLAQITHRLMKASCATRGLTLQEGLEMAVKAWVKAQFGGAASMGAVEVAPGVWRMPASETKAPVPATNPSLSETQPAIRATKPAPIETPAPAAATKPPPFDPKRWWEHTNQIAADGEPITLAVEKQGYGDVNCCVYLRQDDGEWVRDTSWEDSQEEEDPPYDPQAHYDEVRAKGLSAKSALLEVRRMIEDENWTPTAPTNGHAKAAGTGPIKADDYEVPPSWVDSAGNTRAKNLERFGEDESIEYWPPVAP